MSKRVFVAFAVEDKTFREFLAGQAKLDKSPFDGKRTAGLVLKVATASSA